MPLQLYRMRSILLPSNLKNLMQISSPAIHCSKKKKFDEHVTKQTNTKDQFIDYRWTIEIWPPATNKDLMYEHSTTNYWGMHSNLLNLHCLSLAQSSPAGMASSNLFTNLTLISVTLSPLSWSAMNHAITSSCTCNIYKI